MCYLPPEHELEDVGEVGEGVERLLRRFFHAEPDDFTCALDEFGYFRMKRAHRLCDPQLLKELHTRNPVEAWRALAKDFPTLVRVAKTSFFSLSFLSLSLQEGDVTACDFQHGIGHYEPLILTISDWNETDGAGALH